MEFHSLANLFPSLEDKELEELAADIRKHGLREPIVTFEGKILDGRNRYLACERAGVEPRFEEYEGTDPIAYVISLNLKRRHLDESQRSMVAGQIATLQDGHRQVGKFADVPTQAQAAEMLNVSERSVRSAREVLGQGAPELVSAVERGEISVSAASEVASLPKEKQREIVTRGKKQALEAARQIREERAVARREAMRQERPAAAPDEAVADEYAKPPPTGDTPQKSIVAQKADKYFAEQNERLGPITRAILTEDQRLQISGAAAYLRMVRARLANNGVHHFAGDIDRLIERMTILAEKATAA
jgi:ParB-like chromosome segregation protein Spo0J